MMAQQQQLDSGVDGEMTQACPNCDLARSLYYRRTDDDWICWECGHEFEEPVTRPRRGGPQKMNRTQRFLEGCPPSASIDELPALHEEFEADPEGWI